MAQIKLTGDFKQLEQWARKIDSLGGNSALRGLSANLAEEALDLIAEGFKSQKDPAGKAWRKKAFSNGSPILIGKTARLRNSWHRKALSHRGFTVATAVDYAKYHQGGTGVYGSGKSRIKPKNAKALAWRVGGKRFAFRSVKGVPARKMIPEGRDLPPNWRRALEQTTRLYMKSYFR